MIETQNKTKLMVEGFCFSMEFFWGCFLKTPKGHIGGVVKGECGVDF